MCTQVLSCVQLFATPWTIAHPAPLYMKFSRQVYWKLPFPTPGNLPNTRIKTGPIEFPALAGRFFTAVPPGKPYMYTCCCCC